MNITLPADEKDSPQDGNRNLLLLSSIVAALGSFLFGFDTAVISGTTEALRSVFGLNHNLLGFAVSSALLGTMEAWCVLIRFGHAAPWPEIFSLEDTDEVGYLPIDQKFGVLQAQNVPALK